LLYELGDHAKYLFSGLNHLTAAPFHLISLPAVLLLLRLAQLAPLHYLLLILHPHHHLFEPLVCLLAPFDALKKVVAQFPHGEKASQAFHL
jgi:hypothetical protein